jgi:hypothetical protein
MEEVLCHLPTAPQLQSSGARFHARDTCTTARTAAISAALHWLNAMRRQYLFRQHHRAATMGDKPPPGNDSW